MKTSVLPVLFFAALAHAQQPVCATGEVQPVGGPTICMQGETHRLVGTPLLLRSSTVDLNRWVGQVARIEGTDVGLVCRVIDVAVVTAPRAVLQHCGTPMPGCTIKLQVGPGAIGRYALFASFGSGYLPVGCAGPDFVDGSVFLALPAETLALGFFPGPWGELVLPIPNVPSLGGVRILFQGARQDIGPVGPIEFTNLEVIQIVPFMPPCGGINC